MVYRPCNRMDRIFIDFANLKIMRVIFVGLHNKPHMAALDSGTKTGKLVNRIINKLPNDIEIIRSNILDTDELVCFNETYKYANEWYWTHLPTIDDIIILMGAMTQLIYKNDVRHIGNIIRIAHPASKRSHKDMDEFVINTAKKINKILVK